jgi:hypothetical protein
MVHFRINEDLFHLAVRHITASLPCTFDHCVSVMQDMIANMNAPHEKLDMETDHGCRSNPYCSVIPDCR